MSVVGAVDQELAGMGDIGQSALASVARILAVELDKPGNSATSKSMCARQLRETLDRLRELAPAKDEADAVDELGYRRAKRIARLAAS